MRADNDVKFHDNSREWHTEYMTLTNSEIIAVTLQKRKQKKLANLTQCKRPRGAVAVVSF